MADHGLRRGEVIRGEARRFTSIRGKPLAVGALCPVGTQHVPGRSRDGKQSRPESSRDRRNDARHRTITPAARSLEQLGELGPSTPEVDRRVERRIVGQTVERKQRIDAGRFEVFDERLDRLPI